jgi:acyl carrier protein
MSQKSTINRVAEILSDFLVVSAEDVKPETQLEEDLGVDSLDRVDLVMSIEEEWDIQIPDADGDAFRTVGDIVAYVDRHASAAE